LDWIVGKIQRTRIARAGTGPLFDISREECEALLQRVSDFHLPHLDNAPYVLVHGDLHASNIIINEAMKVERKVLVGVSALDGFI